MVYRVYLDNCCFNRPFDDQSHLKIELETRAKLRIQELILTKKLELVTSYILEYENDDNPYEEKRYAIANFMKFAVINVDEDKEVLSAANEVKGAGIKTKDALHVACAIVAGCNYFVTTDNRLLGHKNNRIKVISPIDFILEVEGA